jgi:hypothetical protein
MRHCIFLSSFALLSLSLLLNSKYNHPTSTIPSFQKKILHQPANPPTSTNQPTANQHSPANQPSSHPANQHPLANCNQLPNKQAGTVEIQNIAELSIKWRPENNVRDVQLGQVLLIVARDATKVHVVVAFKFLSKDEV